MASELPNSPTLTSYGDGSGSGIFDLAMEFVDVTTTEVYATWQAMENPDDYHLEAKVNLNFNKILPSGTQWNLKNSDNVTVGSGTLAATSTAQDFFFNAVGAENGTYVLTIIGSRSLTDGLLISGGHCGVMIMDSL